MDAKLKLMRPPAIPSLEARQDLDRLCQEAEAYLEIPILDPVSREKVAAHLRALRALQVEHRRLAADVRVKAALPGEVPSCP